MRNKSLCNSGALNSSQGVRIISWSNFPMSQLPLTINIHLIIILQNRSTLSFRTVDAVPPNLLSLPLIYVLYAQSLRAAAHRRKNPRYKFHTPPTAPHHTNARRVIKSTSALAAEWTSSAHSGPVIQPFRDKPSWEKINSCRSYTIINQVVPTEVDGSRSTKKATFNSKPLAVTA